MAIQGFSEGLGPKGDSGFVEEVQISENQRAFKRVYKKLETIIPELLSHFQAIEKNERTIDGLRERLREMNGDLDFKKGGMKQAEFEHRFSAMGEIESSILGIKKATNTVYVSLEALKKELGETYNLKSVGKDIEHHLGMIPQEEALDEGVLKIKRFFEDRPLLERIQKEEELYLVDEPLPKPLEEEFEKVSKSNLRVKQGFFDKFKPKKKVTFGSPDRIFPFPTCVATGRRQEQRRSQGSVTEKDFKSRAAIWIRDQQNAYRNAIRVLELPDETIDKRPGSVGIPQTF